MTLAGILAAWRGWRRDGVVSIVVNGVRRQRTANGRGGGVNRLAHARRTASLDNGVTADNTLLHSLFNISGRRRRGAVVWCLVF